MTPLPGPTVSREVFPPVAERFFTLLRATGDRLQFRLGARADFVPWWIDAHAAGLLVHLEAVVDGAPIAGLMSDERAEIVAAKAGRLVAAMKACGCNLNNANMQHSLLALVVIPELRISDEGLIDVTTFRKVDVFV